MKGLILYLSLWASFLHADVGIVTCRPAPNCSDNTASPNDGCKIIAGSWCDVTATNKNTNQDECRRVTNYQNSDVFIPAKTDTDDWMTFVSTDTSGQNIFKDGATSCSTGTTHCEGMAISWTVNGKTCNGSLPGPRNFNTVETTSDSSAPTRGSASFLCNNGGWASQSGATCYEDCAGATLSWGSGCSGPVAQASNGATSSSTNSAAGLSGSADFSCNNGTWSGASNPVCNANSCPAQSVGWGSCSGSLASTSSGGSATANNSASGFSGSATYTCSNGNWSGPSSQSCTSTGCPGQSVSWGSSCSGTLAATGSGSSSTATNGASGYSGSATYSCSGGSWTLSGTPTCTSSDPGYWYLSTHFCFIAGTPVTMADGSLKKIQDIRVGEVVRTFDEEKKAFTNSPVVTVFHHPPKPDSLYRITLSDKQSLTPNGIHPIYVMEEARYMKAVDLYDRWRSGKEVTLYTVDGKTVKVNAIDVYQSNERLYNLHVRSPHDKVLESKIGHNYFASGVLVHNKSVDNPQLIDSKDSYCCTQNGGQTDETDDTCTGSSTVHDAFNACMGGSCNTTALDECNKNYCQVGGYCSPDYNPSIVDGCGCPGGKSTKIKCQGGRVVQQQATYCM